KLKTLDPASPFWDDDVREFEKARLEEIEAEAGAAAERQDGEKLNALIGDLSSNEWSERPPNAVVQRIVKLAVQLVASELAAAYSPGSRDRAGVPRERWNALLPLNRLPRSDALAARVDPVLKWIAAEDARARSSHRYQEELAALENMLANRTASLAELERGR